MEFIFGQLELFYKIFKFLLPAIPATIKITLLSFLFASTLGLLTAIARLNKHRSINLPARIYIDVVRGVPLLVQIFFIYFGLGKILNLDRFIAGVVAISICYAAYLAEVFRAGIQAIPKGQTEAALSLGMTRFQLWRHIIIPQTIRLIAPPLVNDFISCLKDSSLVSIIGLRELTRAGTEYYSQHFVDFQTWLLVGLIYLSITLSLTRLSSYFEKKYRIPGLGIHL
ncbi:MAG: amino acid ABC transporter permease [candidate division Zixibacteria bacterium]|nr:amino acid ABC transporter permease [candidate division Zixibacteria bacterium]